MSEKESFWYECEVVSIGNLGRGFGKGHRCYARQHWTPETWDKECPGSKEYPKDHEVFVFNGGYAIRDMSRESARQCLKIVRRLTSEENSKVESRFNWEFNR